MNDVDLKQMVEYEDAKKSLLVTYLLWAFLAGFGGHRFYLGKTGTAVGQLICTLSLVGIVVTFVWIIVDAFLIPGMVRELNSDIRARIIG